MTAQPEQRQPHKPRSGESSTMDAVRLHRVNRWHAQGLSGELADPYVDSRETSAAEAHRSRSRDDFLNRLTGDIRRERTQPPQQGDSARVLLLTTSRPV
ncbi:hypothetical protein ACFWP5_38425 [Streptomyces sp. NPDC058469]|uniref:hypothetical protein n=1 Tax=Streptomyces sp. NPDC058469 TaxID=3346514 RepID=UPI00365D5FF2